MSQKTSRFKYIFQFHSGLFSFGIMCQFSKDSCQSFMVKDQNCINAGNVSATGPPTSPGVITTYHEMSRLPPKSKITLTKKEKH